MGLGAQQVISLSFVMLVIFFVNLCNHYYIPDSPGLYTSGVGSVLAFTLSFSRCRDPVFILQLVGLRPPVGAWSTTTLVTLTFVPFLSATLCHFGFVPLVIFLTFCSHLSHFFRHFYTEVLLAGRYYTPYPVRYRSLPTPSSSDFCHVDRARRIALPNLPNTEGLASLPSHLFFRPGQMSSSGYFNTYSGTLI